MDSGGRRTDDVEGDVAADAIRSMAQARGLIEGDRVVTQVVVLVKTEGDGGPQTRTMYPTGAPDVATEQAMLSRALDDIRNGR